MKRRLQPGDRVRLTGDFLRSTGQIAGGEGQKRWTVIAHEGCGLCNTGDFVAVDEPMYDNPHEARHFFAGNLERCR